MRQPKEVIVTMSKAKFDKLTSVKKRIAVAQDVLDRIKLEQFIPFSGVFCNLKNNPLKTLSVQEKLTHPKTKCEVCAKGGLCTFLNDAKTNICRQKISKANFEKYRPKEIHEEHLESNLPKFLQNNNKSYKVRDIYKENWYGDSFKLAKQLPSVKNDLYKCIIL